MVSTKAHGMIDYVLGVVLILSPFILGFATGGAAMWVPMIIGIAIIIYSLLTAYEYGATSVITMKTHLGLDVASGLVLALSPWIFGFASLVFLPHLLLGALQLVAAAVTERVPKESPKMSYSS